VTTNLYIFPEQPQRGNAPAPAPLAVALTPMAGHTGHTAPEPAAAVVHATPAVCLSSHARVVDAFLAAAGRAADEPAVVTGNAVYRYADIARVCAGVARFLLHSARFRSGDRVGLMLDNGPEYLAAYYGILAAGGVVVPLPPNIETVRLERVVRVCDIGILVTSDMKVSHRAKEIAGDCVSIPTDEQVRGEVPRGSPLEVGGQTLAMIMFTSGSSGEPKGVMLSDRNILANAQSILDYLPIGRHDRALALLPFYHAYGHSVMQTHLLVGATLIVDGAWAFPNSVLDAMERHGATSFAAVPEGYQSLLRYSNLGDRNLSRVKYMSVAGGALSPSCVTEVAQRIAPAAFYVMYGQTEATARLAYLPPALVHTTPNSIGRAIPGVELRVLDEHGREAAVGDPGQLCARGPNIMLGYWNDPVATDCAVEAGWLRTGDLAVRDEQGLLYVRARINELVKVQGFRVHPREVEEAVGRSFPELRMIVVPYCHHETTRLALFAVAAQEDAALIERIRRVCLRELPRHKIPSHVQLLARVPLNACMKTDRGALTRLAESAAAAADKQAAA
jgi:long-chain acyl-CoA synthetase